MYSKTEILVQSCRGLDEQCPNKPVERKQNMDGGINPGRITSNFTGNISNMQWQKYMCLQVKMQKS